ncbi:MAG: hypothetical protein Fur0037_07580 [Planctomycetota bacterium]
MRLPVNFLLYAVSAGLLGEAGYLFYQTAPRLGAPPARQFWEKGQKEAVDLIKRGKGRGQGPANWSYVDQKWWAAFKDVNLTGKLPPPPPEQKDPSEQQAEPEIVQTPLEEIIELVELWYDGKSRGTAGTTHVVVRYKPEAQVEPPPEELRRRQAEQASLPGGGTRLDIVARQGGARPAGANPSRSGGAEPGPSTPPPVSSLGEEWTQYLKPGDALWGRYSNIKLVRVSDDAEIAFFTRELPGRGPGGAEGPPPKEEKLYKLGVGVSNAVMDAIRTASGSRIPKPSTGLEKEEQGVRWIETAETIRRNNTWYIGTNDADRMQGGRGEDEFLAGVGLDSYVSRYDSSVRGVRIVNVDPQLAGKYGVSPGEVILSVNDTPVKTKSEAVNVGKKMYERGTRTFVVKFLTTTGQIVERTYEVPNRS